MAANNRKNKRLQDLEYNVYNSSSNSDNGHHNNYGGCMTLLIGVAITIIVCFIIASVFQMGRNGPSITCATTGCSNRPKPGSSYCWLHSAKTTKSYKVKAPAMRQEDKEKEEEEEKKPDYSQKRKIYSGVGDSAGTSDNSGGSTVN